MVRFWRQIQAAGLIALFTLLGACSGGQNQDLVRYMDEIRAEAATRTRIEPLPAYPPYVAVIYSSAGARSPFDPPRSVESVEMSGTEVNPPDFSRPKEFLEQFNLAELSMVGTIAKDGIRWGLIRDSDGSVHRVKTGNYLGRNYGVITNIDESSLELTEVVVNGQGGWIERPRSLSMGDN